MRNHRRKFILQGFSTDNHLGELEGLLSINKIEQIIISVAFLTEGGFSLISDRIKPLADKTVVVAGIRNGITSVQGLRACLDAGCAIHTVDTGCRGILFHPKLYLSRGLEEARLLLGSANLTVGGLLSNIETGLSVCCDLAASVERELVDDVERKIRAMISGHPENIVEVADQNEVEALFLSGRLADERTKRPPVPSGSFMHPDFNSVPRLKPEDVLIKLERVPKINLNRTEGAGSEEKSAEEDEEGISGIEASDASATVGTALVWESKPLTRRDLTIPEAPGTNPTGSMNLDKGRLGEKTDHRRFFREEAFSGLDWRSDAEAGKDKEHLERAYGDFRLIIKGIDYGTFTLKLTHDNRKDTATYMQGNSMTRIHWKDVKRFVANESLLDRSLRIFRSDAAPNLFIIEID